MKILITGATGFIGKHLSKRLLDDKNDVLILVRKTTNISLIDKKIKVITYNDSDLESLSKVIENEKVDGVIHLASLFLAQHKLEDIGNLISSNVLFPTQIIDIVCKANVKWFINTGTFWQHYNNKTYNPVNLYAASKQAFEDILKYYSETTNINIVTLKLSDTFGQEDIRPKVFNLWSKISISGERLDMSPGKQLIDINYIDNIIDSYLSLIKIISKDNKKKLNGKSFAVKASKRYRLKDLAKIFEKVTNKKLNINWGGRDYRPREVMKPWSKGKNVPGWKQKISIEEGIKKMFN